MNKDFLFDDIKLEEFRKINKLQPFKIKQIYHEVFKSSNIKFEDMTTLSKELRTQLEEQFYILPFKVDKVLDSDETTKIAFETTDWQIIESVIMYHWHTTESGEKRLNRITLCVSSQVWCPVWCLFCVTWKLWIKRNLDFKEILWQVLFANNFIKNKIGKKEDDTLNRIRNIVFMWMWEPLLNYENMKTVLNEFFLPQNRLSLSKRHITISTSWVVPWINRLIEDWLDVMLALSLHAPNQQLRDELIPSISPKYPLDLLMDTIDNYEEKTWNRIFHEYIMIKWKTDTPELAKELVKLLRWKNCHINLIPYNENPAINLEESEQKTIDEFKKILENWWLTVTVRNSLGREHKWACWQLGYEKIKKID